MNLLIYYTNTTPSHSYQWKRGEEDVGGSGGELRVEGVGRTEGGRYTVSAHTDLGTAHAAFMVNVQYGPELVKVKRRVEAERGARVNVECQAEGNPTPLVTWTRAPSEHTRAGEQEGRARNTESSDEVRERGRSSGMGLLSHDVGVLGRGEGVARLRVKAAMWTDTGVYLCHAHNPLGSSPATPLSLVVQQAVRVLGGQGNEGVIWAALGESGRLECRVRAAPPPTFVWSSVGGLILLNSDKYIIHESKLVDGLVTWVSVLEVTDLRPQDYTLYSCTATNALGTHALTLYLRQPGPPFPPHNFTVVNVTEKAAWVSWVANLKGGVPSIYSLRFRTLGGTTYKYVEVSGGVRGARLGPLLAGKHYVVGLAARNFHGASQYITATLPPKTAARSPPTPATTMRGPVEEEWGGRRDKPPPHTFPLHLVLTAAAILSVVLAATACIAHRRSRHLPAKTASAVSSDGTNSLATLGVSLSSSPAHVGHASPESSPTPIIQAHADVLPLTDPEPALSYQYDSAKMSSPPPHTPPFSTSSPPPPTTTNTTTSSTSTHPPTFYPVEPDVCSYSSGVEVGEFQRLGGQVGSLRPVIQLRSADSLQQQHQHPQLVQDTLRSLPQQQLDNSSCPQQQNIHSSLLPQQPSIPNSPCQEQTNLSSLSQQLYALCPEAQLQQTGLILVPEQQTSFISLPQHEKSSSESITQQQVIVSSLSPPPTILSSLQQQSVSRTSSPHQQKPDIAQSPKECWPDVTDYDDIPIHSQSPQHQIQQSESHLYLHQQHDLQQSPQQQSESHLYHHQLTEQHLHFHQDTQHSPQHTGALCQSPQHGTSIHQLPQHQRVHLLSPKRHSRTRVPTFSTFQAIPIQPQQQEPTVEQRSPMHYSKSSQQLPQHQIHCHSPRLKARPHQKHSPQLKHRTQQGYETEPQGGGRSGSPHQLLELPQQHTIRQQSPQREDDSYSLPQQATSISQPSSPLRYSPQQGSPQQ
ncbi:hypothetical protein Pcinc_026674 [Petrolisthes cinctipes]|uniref:Uncharacterized protein n=1 Tax=Petrolisthes cinctipes TaxID=88211 RepID=A0AAE1F627_PETCI|nr:hypothetical protein Pcinc_026674 [Petrolisthes cinctipes]